MPYLKFVCRSCGLTQERYHNARRCPCGGLLAPPPAAEPPCSPRAADLPYALRRALTVVFDDGQQNHDREQGWPPEDPETQEAYRQVYRLTEYAIDEPEPDW